MGAKRKKLRGDQIIWVIILLLAMISIVAVYSSSSSLAYKSDTSTSNFLFKQLIFVCLGFLALFICYRIPIQYYRKFSMALLVVSAAALIYTILNGMIINSAVRWIKIGSITIQPSEVAKISIVLYLARILEIKQFKTFKEFVLWVLLPVGIIFVLCLMGSVSAALIIGIVSFTILICAGVKKSYLYKSAGIGVGMIALIFLVHKTTGAFDRIDTFTTRIERSFNSNTKEMTKEELREYEEKTYQSNQAKQAIQLGGITGRGPGNGLRKNTLPHPYSDFIYTTIIEEAGLIGGIIVLMFYVWFFARCIIIAQNCTKVFSTITVLGLGFLIVLQALIHILVNVGIFPVTGQTLPLVSLGGTSYVFMSCAFGIILSVNRTIEIKIEKEKNG